MAIGKGRLRDELPKFLQQYGRTSRRPGMDPNDRHYDRAVERKVKRMPPEELDRLLRDEDEDEDELAIAEGLDAVREWEAEHGELTPEELAAADEILGIPPADDDDPGDD